MKLFCRWVYGTVDFGGGILFTARVRGPSALRYGVTQIKVLGRWINYTGSKMFHRAKT